MNVTRLVIICALALFITNVINAEDRVVVDFTAAEKTVEWLKYLKTNPSYTDAKQEFMANVAPTAGVQSIIHHWSRFKTWNNDEYFKFIALALGLLKDAKSLSFELPDSFEHTKVLWRDALSNPDKVLEDITHMKQLELSNTARQKARMNLPEEIQLDVDFYFVLFGASTAFAVGKENGFDILQLPRKNDGMLNLDAIRRTIAHEMHHNGFSLATNKYMPKELDTSNIRLLGIMAAEGTASYYNQQPFERLLEDSKVGDGIDAARNAWQTKVPKLPQLFNKAKIDLTQSIAGTYEMRKIYSEWLSGYTGDAYIVGAAMVKLIDEQLGHKVVMELIRDYRKFLQLYNQAAKKANSNGGDYFLYPEPLAEQYANYSQTKN